MVALAIIAAVAVYVAGALGYARWDYIRREVAYRRGEKAPGHHAHSHAPYPCTVNDWGGVEARRCSCNWPIGRAVFWLPYLLLLGTCQAGRRIVCPEVKVPEPDRLSKLESELKEL